MHATQLADGAEGTPLGWRNGPSVAKSLHAHYQALRPSLSPPSRPRQKIFKEKALPDIENYMFENHDQLRQAATECMCNMVVNKEVRTGLGAVGADPGGEGQASSQAWCEIRGS